MDKLTWKDTDYGITKRFDRQTVIGCELKPRAPGFCLYNKNDQKMNQSVYQ